MLGPIKGAASKKGEHQTDLIKGGDQLASLKGGHQLTPIQGGHQTVSIKGGHQRQLLQYKRLKSIFTKHPTN